MGYQLPVRGRKQVEFISPGIQGLVNGTVIPWSEVKKIEGDDESVTIHLKPESEHAENSPYVVPVAKDNELQILNIRPIVEKFCLDNNLITYDKTIGKVDGPQRWSGGPEYDFSKLEDFEIASQPTAPGGF